MIQNIGIIILILFILLGALLLLMQDDSPHPLTPRVGCDDLNDAEKIAEIEDVWGTLREEMRTRPTLGSTSWLPPYHVQFIGNDRAFIAYEDGHLALTSLIEFNCTEEGGKSLSSINEARHFPLDQQDWSDLFKEYGNLEHPVRTYTNTAIVIDNQLINFDQWTEVPLNLFINA